MTSAPVTGGNWASRSGGVVARYSGCGGTSRPRSDAAVCCDSRSPPIASGRARLVTDIRTTDFKDRVSPEDRHRETWKKAHKQTDHRGAMSQAELEETAVENFREYLRIPSVQPDVDYGERSRGVRLSNPGISEKPE